MSESLIVSIGPHIKDKVSTKRIMWAVTLSLLPAGAAGIFIFGMNSLFVMISAIASAVSVWIRLQKLDLIAVLTTRE